MNDLPVIEAVLIAKAEKLAALRSHRRHLSYESSTPFAHVDQREHGVDTIGVLRQTAIAYLGEAPNTLERQEWMLDLGAYGRLPPIALLLGLVKRAMPVCRLIGEVLGLGRKLLEPRTLLLAPRGAVSVEPSLLAMQQLGQLLAVMHVGRGHTNAVHQATATVRADVHFHAEVPLVTLLALVPSAESLQGNSLLSLA